MRGARGGQSEAASQPSPPRGGVFSSIKSTLQGWNSRGADQWDSEPGAAGEGARLSPRAPVLRLAVLLWSAALLAPLPRQAEVEPVRSTLARHLLSRVALLLAAPAQAQDATGAPSITVPNVYRVPAVLGVDLSGITDDDGKSGLATSATYQWVRVDGGTETDISGATNSTYTLAAADVGKTIKVKVSFTDDAGNAEGPLTSAAATATGSVTAAATCTAPPLTGGAAFIESERKVAVAPINAGGTLGYLRSSGAGALDDRSFTVGSNNYNINSVGLASNGDLGVTLDALLTAADRRVLALHVCGASEPLRFADAVEVTGGKFYNFTSTGLDWSTHAERSVWLSRDTVAPTLSPTTLPSVNGATLTLTFDEDLETGSTGVPAAGDFAVTVAGTTATLASSNPVAVSGKTVTLTLATAVTAGQDVTVAYTKPTSGNSLRDAFGNEVATFGAQTATNNTPGVVISVATLAVDEGGTGTYTVVLNTEPAGNVTVTPTSADTTIATVTGALTFTTTNWDTAQTVTVTGAQDTDDEDETVSVTHTVSGYTGVTTAPAVAVSVNDDETANNEASGVPVITVPNVYRVPAVLSVDLSGIDDDDGKTGLVSSATYQWVRVDGGTETDISGATSSTYTLAAADVGKTIKVKVSFTDDANNAEGPLTSAAVPSTGSVTAAATCTAPTLTGGAVFLESARKLAVGKASGDFGFDGLNPSLLFGSLDDRTFTSGGNEITIGALEVTGGTGFMSLSLNASLAAAERQRLTLHVCDTAFRLAAASSPGTFGGITSYNWSNTGLDWSVHAERTVYISRDAVAPSLSATTPLSVNGVALTLTFDEDLETGATGIPAAGAFAVTVAGTDATLVSSNPVTVSGKTVTLTLASAVTAEQDVTVAYTKPASGNSLRDGFGNQVETITARTATNNTPSVVVSVATLSVDEGGTGTYTVVLNTEPSGNVTVTPTSADTAIATVTGALTFTTTNWNTVQTVRVSSVENDVPSEDQSVTVSHGISGGGYGSISVPDVTITVNDDDTPGVSVWQESLSILEGEGGSYTVVLDTQPSGPVTVTASSGDTAVATVTPSSLTFTTSDWNTPKTVTVSSVKDDDIASGDERVSISHTVGGYGDVSSANAVTVTVSDDDTAGVSMSPTSLTLNEGDSDSYTVVLESEPTATVSITPSSDTSDMTLSPGHLTFSSTTWNTPQTVTVTALQDDDNEDETIAVSHSVRGYGSISSGDTVTVTVRDDDEATGEAVIQAWLPRFGRSVAQQVVERVSRRLQQRPQPGLEVSVAGEQLTNRGPWEEEQGIMAKLLGFEAISESQLVEGTEFAFSPSQPHGEADADGVGEGVAFWGGGDLSSFNGQEDTISLSGDVTTALVGADWQRQRWQAGAALAHSWGSGSYEESSREGRLNANLMGLFPYGRYALNPKLTLWGVVGHGWGRLSLLPEDGEQQSTAIQMSMGAVGLDGLLLDGGGSGLTIRSTADALLLRVNSQETEDLAGIQGEVSRLRLGLEAERPFPLSESGAVLTPSLELALRQDGGDAETGFGLDLAAALLWSDPGKGLEVELSGHTLLSHGDAAFHEKGLAASLAWDPNPSSSLGPSLSLSQSMGASAGSGGNDALLAAANWPELETSTRGSAGEDHQFAARLGYGFLAYRDALLITPKLGVALSGDGATTTLGFSLSPYSQEGSGQPWEMVLERQHSNGNSDDPTTQHSLDLRFSLLF